MKANYLLGQFLGLLLAGLLSITSARAQRNVPLEPSESLKQLEIEAGLTPHILAHEPQAIDPVEVTFDDAGRMWVVEMRDYPFRTAEQPRGRIVVLTDSDLDGHYETAQTYADHLEMPNGIALWKDGVVATVAGKLVYFPDADGDLRADSMQTWLEGFKEDNEQLRANHPRLGPDGLWYIACGLRGGQVQLGRDMQANPQSPPLDIGSRDVRFNLRTKSIELITGPAQFGITFDTLGRRIFCSNRNPATQVVFEQADLQNNPLAGMAPSVVDVIPSGDASHVYPLVEAWTTSHLHSGQFTAACGVFLRAGQDLRAEVFACEPTGCLVRRQLSHSVGSHLVPVEENDKEPNREWLASRDGWFRPVNVTLAPDGEMIVVDMHRAVIEHPQFVPTELKQRPDERWGDQAGRVYWVGKNVSGLVEMLRQLKSNPLRQRSDSQLTELIASDNAWLRETAARLLLEREAIAVTEQLQRDAQDSGLSLAARCDALRLAANLADAVGDDRLVPPPDSRTNDLSDVGQRGLAQVALRIGRQTPTLLADHQSQLVELATQTIDSGVRFEAWLSLGALASTGQWSAPAAVVDSAAHSWANSADRYLLIAMASGLRNQPQLFLRGWLDGVASAQSLSAEAVRQIPDIARGLTQAAMRDTADAVQVDISHLCRLINPVAGQSAAAGGTAAQLAALICLEQLVKRNASKSLLDETHWQQVADLSADESQVTANRLAAIGLLARSPRGEDAVLLAKLVRDTTLPELAGPLLSAWTAVGGESPNRYLLDRLPSASPQLQRVILPLIAASPQRLELLAERLESHKIDLRQIGAAELTKLVARAAGPVKQRLKSQLDEISNSNRAEVIARYKDCLTLPTDRLRGTEVFRKHCASCHRIGEIGVDVGPNISDSRTKQPLELLTSILDPNLAIDNNYFRFMVMTEDGRVVEGIIAEETADALVIRGQDDRRERIRRDEIAEMKAAGVSLMPEGIESQIDQQAMADLIAFIKGWRYLDGAVPVQ